MARIKKEQTKVNTLIYQIHKLEKIHKLSLAASPLNEPTQARAQLSEELNMKAKDNIFSDTKCITNKVTKVEGC